MQYYPVDPDCAAAAAAVTRSHHRSAIVVIVIPRIYLRNPIMVSNSECTDNSQRPTNPGPPTTLPALP